MLRPTGKAMGKRSRAGGVPKRRPRKKPVPKRSAAPKLNAHSPSFVTADETELARLSREGAVIFQREGGVYRFAAGYSLLPAYLEIERQSIIAPGPGTVVGRAAIRRQVVRIDDLLSDPLYEQKEESKAEGNRSMIGVPLLRDGEPVVVIGLGRRRIDPFGDREIELATTFAAQAMIAIENARLLNELRQRTTDLTEALEQQTATS